MKRILSLTFLLIVAVMSFAGNVGEQQAWLKAQAFLKANNRTATAAKAKKAAHKMPRKGQSATSVYFYVFNADNNQGFVIVAGDDRVDEILGYADSGSFDADNIPSNLQYMLDCYAEDIEWMIANNYTPSSAPRKVSTTVVEPLVTSKWNQSAPYYNSCPTLNGSRCVTGCVATAMAQIMYYHKWPQGSTGSIAGYTSSSGAVVSTLNSTTFDWSNMQDTYNNSSSAASQSAVAKLMAYCGAAVSMNYSPSSSGAVSSNVPTALINKFGYASSAKFIGRSGYSIDGWDALITNELVNNRPVYLSGSTSQGEGHAFVCDGRRADGLFHINWGWGGSCDGYYRLSLLDPTSQGIGGSSTGSKYSVRQGAIVGIAKSTAATPGLTTTVTAGRQSIKTSREYSRSSTSNNFSSITVATPYWYPQGTYTSASIGLALYQDGVYKSLLTSQSRTYVYNSGSYNISPTEMTFSFGANLADGVYQIVPVYQSSSSWVKAAMADQNYIEATISGRELKLNVFPQADFEVTSTSFNNDNLIVNFVNNSEEYNGSLYLFTKDGTLICQEMMAVPAGVEDRINLYVSPSSSFSMEEQFFLSTDYYRREYFYTNLVTENSVIDKQIDLVNATEDKTSIYGKTIRYKLSLNNSGTGVYRHKVISELVEKGSTTAIASNSQMVEIAAGNTQTVEQEFTLTDDQMNKEYYIRSIHMSGDRQISKQSGYFMVGYGATIWDIDGNITSVPSGTTFVVPENAVAIDLRSVGTNDITPNSNPNTLYLLENVPTSLKGKNVVNSLGRTGSLTFYDGYPYFIPQLVQTKKIYYKRTFTSQEAGSWTTMALPFAPNVVKNDDDGKSLTWHTSDTDTGKDIWVQELTDVQGNNMVFTNIESFTENRPYIISVPADLAGKTLSFQKELSNIYVDLQPTDIRQTVGAVTLYGTYVNTDATDKYVFSSEKFVRADYSAAPGLMMAASGGVIVPPFRVYAEVEGSPYSSLTINSSHTTGVSTILTDEQAKAGNEKWYTINGVQLNSRPTAKGIYIKNDKKVVLR